MNLATNSESSVIQLCGVSKRYGRASVLKAVNLDLPAGAFAGLAGVNGAGKTTLIKCLLDFCSLDGGEIRIFGLPHRLPEARKRLAFLPERFTPPYYLTGREFIRIMLAMSRHPYEESPVCAMFEELDLQTDALDKPVRSFSKGMTQKLGLAACLLLERDLYLLDEPMSGLDPKARALVKALLQRLKQAGRTLLFTSHSLADIEEICDHMLVLHQGGIAFSGTPRELREHHDEPTLERAFLRCIETHA